MVQIGVDAALVINYLPIGTEYLTNECVMACTPIIEKRSARENPLVQFDILPLGPWLRRLGRAMTRQVVERALRAAESAIGLSTATKTVSQTNPRMISSST